MKTMPVNFAILLILVLLGMPPLGCAARKASKTDATAANSVRQTALSPFDSAIEDLLMPEVPEEANPGSLWSDTGYKTFMSYDRRATSVGDLVTIEIINETNSVHTATTSLARQGDWNATVSALLGLDNRLSELAPNINPATGVSTNQSSAFSGEGNTSRKGSLESIITARVIGVLKNGNMLVSGHQEVKVNGDLELLTIRGIIRPQDISINNTIPSYYVAEARIRFEGGGVVAEKQIPGWGTRVMDKVYPF